MLELQGYLSGPSRVPGIEATPGRGTHVPLFILGSSLFGAQLAAMLGLPYSFASHFAPGALQDAVSLYRRDFRPSAAQPEPYVIAGVNVIAADTEDEAARLYEGAKRSRVRQLVGRGRTLTPDEEDLLMASPAAQQAEQMMRYTGVGTVDQVRSYLDDFARTAQADELILVSSAPGREAWLRSLELLSPMAC